MGTRSPEPWLTQSLADGVALGLGVAPEPLEHPANNTAVSNAPRNLALAVLGVTSGTILPAPDSVLRALQSGRR
jgi:hypothetical protein